MRRLVFIAILGLSACRHRPPRAPQASPRAAASPATSDPGAPCTAQREENQRRAWGAAACTTDGECVHAGQYETGTCDAWVARPGADALLGRMRAATDAACREVAKVVVVRACRAAEGRCVAGRCTGRPSGEGAAAPAGNLVAVVPEHFRCVAAGLRKVAAERKVVQGRVELRFPLAVDGRPPRFFEVVGPLDPDAAAGAARAFAACRWRLQDGGAIPSEAWGSMALTLKE